MHSPTLDCAYNLPNSPNTTADGSVLGVKLQPLKALTEDQMWIYRFALNSFMDARHSRHLTDSEMLMSSILEST